MTEAAEQDNPLLDSPRMPHPGQLVAGRYEVERVLGSGGFGVVYLARDRRAGGEVALKVLDPQKSERPQFAARFRQEVLLVRNLKHHNTIKVQDVGETDNGCLFMAMEYVEGESLASLIEATGGLSPGRAVRITAQILRSLSEAHSRGIIHRDLKPGNIMVAQLRGEPDYVKVLDFGIAKALSPELSQVKTQTSELMCTPAFAAPELLRGREALGPPADLYALGLIMIEMLKGGPVFTDNSMWGVVAQQLSPEPIPIPDAIAATPLGAVIRKAVEKDKAARYATADEMLADLLQLGLYPNDMPTLTGPRAAEQGGPQASMVVTPPGVSGQTAPQARRRHLRAWAAALLLLGAGAAAAYALMHASVGPPASVGGGPDAGLTQQGHGGTTPVGGAGGNRLGSGQSGVDPGAQVAACGDGDSAACLALVATALDPAAAALDRPASATSLQTACDGGGMAACVPLGALYEAGGAVPQDYHRAFALYQHACDAGIMSGCVRAGRMVATARGAPRDDVQAVQLYRQGCDGGDMEGCLNLGAMYFSGQGVGQSYELSHAFFQQACNGGNMQGCAVLGALYYSGRGFGQDYDRARSHYERACNGGEPAGCAGLAALYEQGLGVDADPRRAVGLYEQACGQGSADACNHLGHVYQAGTLAPADPDRAAAFFRRACQLGSDEACALSQEPR